MPYLMTEITDRVRIGVNAKGDFHIEVYDLPRSHVDAGYDEVFIPANAASDLGKFLMVKS